MTTDTFWKIIEDVHRESGGDMDCKCSLLEKRLLGLDEEDLRGFTEHFDRLDAEAYSWSLWAAADVMNGGCGDDTFSDFRAALISQGREIYERAMVDPDSLVELETGSVDLFHEGYQYVAHRVCDQRGIRSVNRMMVFPDEPSGEEWKQEDLPRLLPRLSARYDPDLPDEMDGRELMDGPRVKRRPRWQFWK